MQHYDPLVACGILPVSVKTILEKNGPITLPSGVYIPPKGKENPIDTFVPSQEKKSGWKSFAMGALITGLALFGLKKLGINPLKKLTSSAKFQSVKQFCTDKLNKFTQTNIWQKIKNGASAVKNFFTKKP